MGDEFSKAFTYLVGLVVALVSFIFKSSLENQKEISVAQQKRIDELEKEHKEAKESLATELSELKAKDLSAIKDQLSELKTVIKINSREDELIREMFKKEVLEIKLSIKEHNDYVDRYFDKISDEIKNLSTQNKRNVKRDSV